MSGFDAIAVGRRVLQSEGQSLALQAKTLDETFALAVDLLSAAQENPRGGRIVCTGMGKSGHVARKIAATFASTGSQAFFVHPAEASHGDLGMIGEGDVILALSKSGEVRELADLLAYAKRFSIPLIAITGAPESALGRAADAVVRLADAPEATAEVNAPTTSTTLQIALGDALAVALLERRGFRPQDFHVFHPGGKLGAMLRTVRDLMHGGEELPLVAEDAPMREALLVMTGKRFGIVGVRDPAGRLVGAISDGDLRRHFDGLLDRTAAQVMTPGPKKTVPPDMLASEALAVMTEGAAADAGETPSPRVTVLFVVERGRPVGILHVHDLLRVGVM